MSGSSKRARAKMFNNEEISWNLSQFYTLTHYQSSTDKKIHALRKLKQEKHMLKENRDRRRRKRYSFDLADPTVR